MCAASEKQTTISGQNMANPLYQIEHFTLYLYRVGKCYHSLYGHLTLFMIVKRDISMSFLVYIFVDVQFIRRFA